MPVAASSARFSGLRVVPAMRQPETCSVCASASAE
jgi:hypothetical protein